MMKCDRYPCILMELRGIDRVTKSKRDSCPCICTIAVPVFFDIYPQSYPQSYPQLWGCSNPALGSARERAKYPSYGRRHKNQRDQSDQLGGAGRYYLRCGRVGVPRLWGHCAIRAPTDFPAQKKRAGGRSKARTEPWPTAIAAKNNLSPTRGHCIKVTLDRRWMNVECSGYDGDGPAVFDKITDGVFLILSGFVPTKVQKVP